MLQSWMLAPIFTRFYCKLKLCNSKQISKPCTAINSLKNVLLMSGFYNAIKSHSELEKEVDLACEKGEQSVISLLDTIKTCITEISKEYRDCIEHQINITASAIQLGPIGSHWDELTKYRVHADDLKHELANYQALLKMLGQLTEDQAFVSFMSSAKGSLDLANEAYSETNELLQQELKENQTCDMRLLIVSRDSILKTINK